MTIRESLTKNGAGDSLNNRTWFSFYILGDSFPQTRNISCFPNLLPHMATYALYYTRITMETG